MGLLYRLVNLMEGIVFIFIWMIISPTVTFSILDDCIKSYFNFHYNQIHGSQDNTLVKRRNIILLKSKSFHYDFLDLSIKGCSSTKYISELIHKYRFKYLIDFNVIL